jgi:hypothetical protein
VAAAVKKPRRDIILSLTVLMIQASHMGFSFPVSDVTP